MTPSSLYLSFIRPVDFNSASALLQAVQQAMQEGHTAITLMISSGGGHLIPGFALYNQLRLLPLELTVYNIGSVNSIATIVFLAGTHRLATPNATFLFHGTSWDFGHAGEIPRRHLLESVSALAVDEARMHDAVVSRTSLSLEEIRALMLDGSTKDAQFAQDHQLIHEIGFFPVPEGTPCRQI